MPPPSHMPTKRFFASPSSVPLFQQTRRLTYRYFPHISVCYNLFFSPITAPRFIVATIPHTFSASCVVFCIALYRPISLSLNTGSLFCQFAHLLRQRRHACGGNVPQYAPAPLGLASLYLHQTDKKHFYRPISLSLNTGSLSPYFAIAQYGLWATAMCSGVPPLRAYAFAAVLCARYAVRIRTAFSSKTSHARMHSRRSHNNRRPSDGALSKHLDARRRHSTVAYSRESNRVDQRDQKTLP